MSDKKSSENPAPKLELVEPTAPESIFDDLDSLRKESVIQVKRKVVKVNITVGKPKNTVHFRSHPTLSFDNGLIIPSPENREDYFYIAPAMKDHWCLKHRIREVVIAVVYSWPGGLISLWPVNKSDKVKCWRTAYAAYEGSKTDWTMMIWDDAASDYEVTTSANINIEPLWPADLDFKNLLKLGFAGKIIADEEHPYVRQLRGISD